jgi:hypothetical protein
MGLLTFISDLFSDTRTDRNGYKRYWDSNKSEHRTVAEKKLGRKLRPGEVVHHIDRDKTNNHPNNLWVFPNQKAHDNAHKEDFKRFGKASYTGFKKKKGFWDLF